MKNENLSFTDVFLTFVVVVVAVLFAISASVPRSSRTDQYPLVQRDGEWVIEPSRPTLGTLPLNKKVCSDVFFTSKGVPFAWPDLPIDGPFCSATIWHDARGWHGKLRNAVNIYQITGYDEIPAGKYHVVLEK